MRNFLFWGLICTCVQWVCLICQIAVGGLIFMFANFMFMFLALIFYIFEFNEIMNSAIIRIQILQDHYNRVKRALDAEPISRYANRRRKVKEW